MATLILTLPRTGLQAGSVLDYVLSPDGLAVGTASSAPLALLPNAGTGRVTETLLLVDAAQLSWHRVQLPAGTLPGFPDGMVIGQHGSWNRSKLSGYKVIFVPFVNGKPSGPPRDILTDFLSEDEKYSYGRPVGVTLKDGALLVADDVGNVIWRVTGA